jgi:hypothetical protein
MVPADAARLHFECAARDQGDSTSLRPIRRRSSVRTRVMLSIPFFGPAIFAIAHTDI